MTKLAKGVLTAGCAVLMQAIVLAPAQGQFGYPLNLPSSDFRWVWGRNAEDALGGKFEDFSVRNGDAGFDCQLTGRLSPGSRLTMTEVRELERQLQTSLYFIQTAANTMYTLDQQLELDWAVLDCQRPEAGEATAEEVEARQDKARERAERKRERRRERDGLPEGVLPPD